ncbi:MAG: Gldg family protein, partial [Planctomycetales bacterium]|nr:Gldg family protein [Planctomycetales bacterium]
MNEVTSIVKLLVIDAVLVLICVVILMALSMIKKATYAVYKRNLLSYFANPVGYIFLCAFVATCSAAAFVGLGSTNEFFVTNLANLDLLNGYIQWILLLFIPTITMSLWAEERRLGTDELLLTIPASDWDIVLGKYLASAAIFGISLLVSQISNFVVLALLAKGDVDIGLFVTTYCGYFMMGLAMISLGMVVSFLTKNLAIGFILGVLANVPLVFSHDFSFAEQSFDFFRGVVSLRSFVFFALVIGLGLYLSVVLIGRRHWYGGKDGESKVGHYLFRAIALVMTVVCLSMFFSKNVSMRYDTTTEQISSLSQKTVQLVRDVDDEKVVVVEAFISQDIPEDYAQTKSDLITKLNEFNAKGGNRLQVRIFDNLEPFSDEAERANEQYGIKAVPVTVTERGAMKSEEIFLGAAFTCGLEKVVVPFFDRGIPVEYELIRSVATVSGEQRKKLGIVNTGARLYGGFDMQTMGQTPKQLIVEELEKQYEVVQVDAGSRIEEELDVMLVVQPSSLNQMQLDNVTEAIRKGIPTAIFEDPAPVMIQAVGTSQPNPPRGGGGMFGGGGPPEPKADYQKLFATLGIEMYGRNDMGQFSADVIWQNYNPYKKAQGLPQMSAEWVFISPDNVDADQPFNPDSPVVSGLNQLLLLYPGAIKNLEANGLEFTPLAQTGKQMGVINFQDLSSARDPIELEFLRKSRTAPEVVATLAAWIKAKDYKPITDPTDESATDKADPADAAAKSSTPENNINVIFVADIDLMGSDFLRIRAQPDMGG